jgi:hypothetical protein
MVHDFSFLRGHLKLPPPSAYKPDTASNLDPQSRQYQYQ